MHFLPYLDAVTREEVGCSVHDIRSVGGVVVGVVGVIVGLHELQPGEE